MAERPPPLKPMSVRLAARRRRMRRRQIRRRRLSAIGLLASIAVLLVAVLALGGVRGHHRDSGSGTGSGGNRPGIGEGPGAEGSAGAGTVGAAPAGGARPGPGWLSHRGPVPILMYHVIGDPAAGAEYPSLYVSVPEFRSQVEWLDEHGYTAVTLDQVQAAWYDGAELPPKPIVLSFDDGYLGQYVYAMPILRSHGWAGQLNLKAKGSDLSTTEVEKMIRAGWEVAAHTIDHLDLTTLDPGQLRREVAGSRRILRRELGVPVHNFCYPAGRYDDQVIAAVRAAGYRGATTTDPGLARRQEPFRLRRIRVDGGDGAPGLAADLAAAGA